MIFACLCVVLGRPIVSDADINQKGTFLSDSLREVLPAGSKNKGRASTKPTVPRSTSQPGNHQREKERNWCVWFSRFLFFCSRTFWTLLFLKVYIFSPVIHMIFLFLKDGRSAVYPQWTLKTLRRSHPALKSSQIPQTERRTAIAKMYSQFNTYHVTDASNASS